MPISPTARSGVVLALCVVGAVGIGLVCGSGVPSGRASVVAWLNVDDPGHAVLTLLRGPRVAAGFAVGALLGLAGALLQVLLRNPLAEPFVLGLSGGAALGALTAIVGAAGAGAIALASAGGALVSLAVLLVIARAEFRGHAPQRAGERLILTGVMLAAVWGALITLTLSTSADTQIQAMIFWLMGDLAGTRAMLWPWIVGALALGIAMADAPRLNLLARGEDVAASLGVRVGRLKLRLVILSAICAGAAVALAGPVGFVGLLAPHLMRATSGSNHRLLIPGAALLGGSIVVLGDAAGRTLFAPLQLPVGAITAVGGAPLLLYFLWRAQR